MPRIVETSDDVDLPFKIILIGDEKTGKTNLYERLGEYGKWHSNVQPTIGVVFLKRTIKISDKPVILHFWDIEGSDRTHWIRPTFYKKTPAVFLVYDIANRNSFDNIQDWLDGFLRYDQVQAQIVIVGNKCDLEDQREVSYEEGRLFAEKRNYKFVEVSAKTMENVNYLARLIATDLEERRLKIKEEERILKLEGKKTQDLIRLREKNEEKKKSICAT